MCKSQSIPSILVCFRHSFLHTFYLCVKIGNLCEKSHLPIMNDYYVCGKNVEVIFESKNVIDTGYKLDINWI